MTRAILLALWTGAAVACAPAQTAGVPVLMLSDLHFDPFRDSAKVARLDAAPIAEWDEILKEPNSATQAESFAALQTACKATKGLDSDYGLLSDSLKAARKQAPGVKFVTISGDLLVHQFDCRYRTVMKTTDDAGYARFAEKTASYVMRSVEREFAEAPVYFALGNNDSACGDYMLDEHDKFLAGTSATLLEGLRGASAAELKQAREDYDTGGYFAVTLPAPMQHAKLLVLDDMYMARKYSDCGKKADPEGSVEELAWLQRQLDAARKQGEKVWVMGHIPPGVDVYSTLRDGDVCQGSAAVMFLSPEATGKLGALLANYADVVPLAIFGHTHMDEVKLLQKEKGGGVPVKLVASISPVDGNLPSFTVAQVNPATAVLEDYTVYMASNKTGVGTAWTREYGFKETYHQPAFSAAALEKIIAGFRADPGGAAPASKAYEEYFDKGLPLSPLVLAWPQYACAIDHYSPEGFRACMCPTK
jgi:sphingomyelin phosphodiesterase acid-like 3